MLPALTVPRVGRRRILAGGAGLLTLPMISQSAWAQATKPGAAEITVDRARNEPIAIALPAFTGDNAGLARDIVGVISNNLSRSGLFRVIDPAAYINAAAGDAPNFANWKAISAQALVTGKVDGQGGGKVRVEFRLWDVLQGAQIQGTAYSATLTDWRRIAHIMSDVIYERMLGEKGYFDTRIVYIAMSGPKDRRVLRLAVMDQDGENNKFLTDGSFQVRSPRFHPTQDRITFLSYANNRPRVYTFDLSTGRSQILGQFEDMTQSPRFAPDGGTVVMAQTRGGGSDIISVSANGGGLRRLTDAGGAIDVSPCYSPDGTQIVFNSDRGGDQQLYVMDAGGGGIKRISFGASRQYATPVWSPRGDLIAFTSFNAATFSIGVMRPDGSGERILSESFFCEGPTFAPNGRMIAFTRETASQDSRGRGYSSKLVTIDIAGFNERVMTTPIDAGDASWSPLGQ